MLSKLEREANTNINFMSVYITSEYRLNYVLLRTYLCASYYRRRRNLRGEGLVIIIFCVTVFRCFISICLIFSIPPLTVKISNNVQFYCSKIYKNISFCRFYKKVMNQFRYNLHLKPLKYIL